MLGHDDIVSFTEMEPRLTVGEGTVGMTFDKIIYRRCLSEDREVLHGNAPFALYRLARREPVRSSVVRARQTVVESNV